MKNWSQFKNWLMALLACEVILLVLCFLYARAIILEQIWLALAAYFSYAQMFIVVSIDSISSIVLDKVLQRKETKWVKTKRFAG